MVANPPDALAPNKDAAITPATTALKTTAQKSTKRAGSEESDSDDGETPIKKAKKEESSKCRE